MLCFEPLPSKETAQEGTAFSAGWSEYHLLSQLRHMRLLMRCPSTVSRLMTTELLELPQSGQLDVDLFFIKRLL